VASNTKRSDLYQNPPPIAWWKAILDGDNLLAAQATQSYEMISAAC